MSSGFSQGHSYDGNGNHSQFCQCGRGGQNAQLPRWNPDYDPTSPEEQAKVKAFMDNHAHQYQCAICGKEPNQKENDK